MPPASGGQDGGGTSRQDKSGRVAIILVILLAVALGALAWYGWQHLETQQQRVETQQQRLQTLSNDTADSVSRSEVDALESRIESAENARAERLDTALSDLRDEFSDYRSSVNETLDQVLAQLSQEQDADERDWLHAEAAYLLRLANQRLQLEGDVPSAAALLRTADARLVDANNPALTPVRREIASELAALQAVPQVDRDGTYLALNALQEQIAGLRLSQEIEEPAVSSGIEQPPSGPLQRQLARFGEELKDLVVIRNHDEALETLITPEQETYLRQSLRLILEQTQLALLDENQTLYETSINKALDLLDSYFDTSRSETQGVITRLETLRGLDITPELPDISDSQQRLAEFIENRFESRSADGGDS